MKGAPAHHVALEAMEAAWYHTTRVEGSLDDMDGAIAGGEWATAMECGAIALGYLTMAASVLAGARLRTAEAEVFAHLALGLGEGNEEGGTLARYAALPAAPTATEADVLQLRAEIQRLADALNARIPFTVPKVRTPTGFFPTLRMGSELESLRRALGARPFDWAMDSA